MTMPPIPPGFPNVPAPRWVADPSKPGGGSWVDSPPRAPMTSTPGGGNLFDPATNVPPTATPPSPTAPPPVGQGLPGGPGFIGPTTNTDNYDQLNREATAAIDRYSEEVRSLGQRASELYVALGKVDPTDQVAQRYATQAYDAAAAAWQAGANNLQKAYDNRVAVATKALDSHWMQPGQQEIWRAQAARDDAQAKQLIASAAATTEASGAQKALLIAQGTSAVASAHLADAQANSLAKKTPAEIQQLQASANQANASANLTNQQAALAQASIPTAQRANEASTRSLEQAALAAITKNRQAPTDSQAVAANQAGVDLAMAQARQAVQNAQKQVLGPTFGLQDQLAAIKQIADGVKSGAIPWTGDPAHLDQMLSQYLSATLGGTTVAGAAGQAQAAQEAGQSSLTTQRQQNIGLQQSAMSTMGNIAGQGIGGLMGMVKDLPAGDTSLAGAVQAMLHLGQGAVSGPQFQPPPMVQPPAMPSFLQGFMGPQQSDPSTVAAAVHAAVSAAAAPSAPSAASPAPPAMPPAAPQAFAQSDQAEGGSRGLPGILQPHAPADEAFVNQLYGRAA